MSTDAEPIQLAQRLDFESKHFSEGSVLRGPISDPLLKPGAFSDPTKDHADVEQRREAHLAEVKAKAGAEVEHAKEVAAAHKAAVGANEPVVDLAKVPAE